MNTRFRSPASPISKAAWKSPGAIKREVYEKYPWVAQSLYKGFAQAQKITYEDLRETAALKVMLPWLIKHVEDTESILGKDFWPYGMEPNVKTLSTFLRYSFEQ